VLVLERASPRAERSCTARLQVVAARAFALASAQDSRIADERLAENRCFDQKWAMGVTGNVGDDMRIALTMDV
jgi:hypothetical protein